MPRKAAPFKLEPHRPLIKIDWDLVDEQLSLGCEGTQVAEALGISADTLYDRCKRDKGMGFSYYMQQKRANGIEYEIRKAQMQLIKEKNPTMCIFLGKVYLKQRDADLIPEEKNKAAIVEYLDRLKETRTPSTFLP